MTDLELSESEISTICCALREAATQNFIDGYKATSDTQDKLADKVKAHLLATGVWKGEAEEAA